MKIGIDTYSYHRFFGETYAVQPPLPQRMSMEDVITRVVELGVDGVSIESCFLPSFDEGYLKSLKDLLDHHGLERVYAWGHPRGLEAGGSESAFQDMIASINNARIICAPVMRVVSGNRALRSQPHGPQIENLIRMYREAVRVAADCGLRLAVENHLDFNSDELLHILEEVNSPILGINFDSGNFMRLGEDPTVVMRKLGKHVFATHLKDLRPAKSLQPPWDFAFVPLGQGVLDNRPLFHLLKDSGYTGLLAVEIDFLHPDYAGDEDAAVAESVAWLKNTIRTLD